MSTAVSARPDVVTRHNGRELEEVLAPEMFSFTKPGESISGVLLSIDGVTVKGKQVTQYLIRLDDDRRLQLLATYDLGRKVQRGHIGRFVEITYVGENREVKKGDNYLREFRVRVEKLRAQQDNPEFTDEDIPF
jgi:hypothetical protein